MESRVRHRLAQKIVFLRATVADIDRVVIRIRFFSSLSPRAIQIFNFQMPKLSLCIIFGAPVFFSSSLKQMKKENWFITRNCFYDSLDFS